jgi:hypothetical protein
VNQGAVETGNEILEKHGLDEERNSFYAEPKEHGFLPYLKLEGVTLQGLKVLRPVEPKFLLCVLSILKVGLFQYLVAGRALHNIACDVDI